MGKRLTELGSKCIGTRFAHVGCYCEHWVWDVVAKIMQAFYKGFCEFPQNAENTHVTRTYIPYLI
jgi:hypothetical protein